MVLLSLLSFTCPCTLLRRAIRFGLLSFGRGTLEYVQVPVALSHAHGARARRLVRTSQLSAW